MNRFVVALLPIFITACSSIEPTDRGRLIINEILVRNNTSTGVVAPNGDKSDYIELYNAGNDTVHLNRYFLTDQRLVPSKRNLPVRSLAPGEFAVFYGGKSKLNSDSFLGFSLSSDSSDGEMVCLFDSAMNLVDSLEYLIRKESLKKGKAFGRLGNGGSKWVEQKWATPGKPNNE